ncbi:MAG: XRE family transcriptional regulator [Clostridia bacterium]|nr:XRE family transcriptional regulator [Clostridia bacterium]
MGQKSGSTNKSIYTEIRERLGYTRESACALLRGINEDRLEKIENNKLKGEPHPDEILTMADVYKEPYLCNYYCSHICSIGKKYVPSVKVREFSQIALSAMDSVNELKAQQDKFIKIAADGAVGDDEIRDFVRIQLELKRISQAVNALNFWSEKMLEENVINKEKYEKILAETK